MKLSVEKYRDLLDQYIQTQDEKALYETEKLSKQSIQDNITPDEIIDVHIQAINDLFPNLSLELKHGMNFLLQAMISYGLAYQNYQVMREKQLELKSEISVAANMQETLLSTVKPEIIGVDIGAISIPAKQMNGDYHHFIKDGKGNLGVAIADVIGKGIPAALCMSMIKYAMDSFSEERMDPKSVLDNLNRVVARNIDPSMFITMFYGVYMPENHKFYYASAGHEPGFYFDSALGEFKEIEAKGIVLGVSNEVNFKQYEREVKVGDMIILLTDGVTECRQGDRFIESEEVLRIIKRYIHLPAQEMVENVYRHFERLQDFQLRDDFTLLILKREV